MQPLVSIIVPIFNSERYLASAILAIDKQTYPNKEIILVDDGSTDSSYTIAKQYENEHLKVIRQINSGAAVARNTGFAHALGEYIQFMDVDDFLSVDKIEKQVEALKHQPGKVAVCDYIEFFQESELSSNHKLSNQTSFIYSTDKPAEFLLNLYGGNDKPHFIQTNSWLVPRHLIEKAGGWRNYRCPDDDGEFFSRILLASQGIIHVPGVYNYYRRTTKEASLSSNTKKKYLQNSLLSIDLKLSYLRQHKESKMFKKAFATQYLLFCVNAYPKHKILSNIAYKRYKSFQTQIEVPKLGGTFIELIKNKVSWRAARAVKYFLRER